MQESPDHLDDLLRLMNFSSAGQVLSDLLYEPTHHGVDVAAWPEIDGYIPIARLGAGGGGDVFRAHRPGSEHPFALKVLRCELDGRGSSRRVWRELEVLEKLRLPVLPRLHDYGVHDNHLYLVTEHVEGLSLLDHCRVNRLSLRKRVELLVEVARAVEALHQHGVIHRDIKPDNIIIDRHGKPVIIDFGLAALLVNDPVETLTLEGQPLGSPSYMSPEQARGEREPVRTLTDVYSLGATACMVLTGEPPHPRETGLHQMIRRVAQEPARRVQSLDPDLPAPLAAVIQKAISFEPSLRYRSAAEFGDELSRWLRGEPVECRRAPLWRRAAFSARRHPWFWSVGAAACFFAVLSLFFGGAAYTQNQLADEQRTLRLEAESAMDLVEAERARALEAKRSLEFWESEYREFFNSYLTRLKNIEKSEEPWEIIMMARSLGDVVKEVPWAEEDILNTFQISRDDLLYDLIAYLYPDREVSDVLLRLYMNEEAHMNLELLHSIGGTH